MDNQVTESLALLRAALSAVQAAYADLPELPEGMGNYDAPQNRLAYMVRCLRDCVKDAWVNAQAFPTVESLSGWPAAAVYEGLFEPAAKAASQQMFAALKPLAALEATDEDKSALAGVLDEIKAGLEALKPKEVLAPIKESLAGSHAAFVSSTTFISEGSNPERNQYRMLVIKEGLSGNRNLWKGPVLKASVGLLESRPIYLNHAAAGASRSIADKVGWWSDVSYVEGLAVGDQGKDIVSGIVATANLLENSAHPWLPGMIREALQKGQPNIVGVSIDAPVSGTIRRGADKQLFRDIESINAYSSADIVAEPGAGGQPLAVLEGLCSDEEIMELEGLTIEQLREARPELFESIAATAREGYTPVTAVTPPAPVEPPTPVETADPRVTEALTRFEDATRILNLREQSLILESLLVTSGLPENVRAIVRTEVGDNVMAREAMAAIVDRYVEVSRSVVQESALTSATIIPFRGTSVAENQVGPLDQVSAALDAWFGNPDSAMEGKYHPISSMKQFYVDVTGDRSGGVDGMYNAKESVIGRYLGMNVQEALPGQTHIIGGSTITLPALFGTSMNRALTKKYRAQDLWWEPIVEKTRLDNFKQQQRVRMHSFGSLTERTVGTEEYTELDWAETSETYTPTGYGNVVPINRRAFINDDMEGLRRIPTLLAESAGYTINEAVANLFTQNSGNGPTLTDTVQVFNAASHQGNRITAALSRTSLTDAIKISASMTNDAGKRVGWKLKNLLVPIDLADTAYELLTSEKAPGSANNEPNFIKSNWGVSNMIVVPQFTDVNNWYAMPDSSDITNIEVGFILGRQDPEFFIQNGPTEGIVFTHDAINFKVRHEYGMDWIDYHGAIGSIVA